MKKLFAIVIASVFGLATVTAFATTPAAPVKTAAAATAPAKAKVTHKRHHKKAHTATVAKKVEAAQPAKK